MSDALMLRLQDGDKSAFNEMFEEWNNSIVHFVYKSIRNWEDAREISQDVWTSVLTRCNTFVPSGMFNSWLFKVAKNAVIDFRRRNKYRQHDHSIDRDIDEGVIDNYLHATGDTVETANASDAMKRVESVLPLIPMDQQMAFTMYVFCGMTCSEIAKAMDSSIPTTKSRLRLAREKIRLELGIVMKQLRSTGFVSKRPPLWVCRSNRHPGSISSNP